MSQNTTNVQSVEEVLRGRHSVRYYEQYDMPEQELNEILELTATAPSAWNLQHWRFLVFTKPETKQRALPIAYNQQQVVTSSATVVILGDLEADKSAAEIYGPIVKSGNMSQEVADKMLQSIQGAYQNKQYARDAAFSNASLAAMQLSLAAKAKGFDTVMMGGFDSQALIKEFNIPERYVPVMMITIGKAAKPAHPSARFDLDTLVIRESF